MLEKLNVIILASKKHPAINIKKNKDHLNLLGSKNKTTLDWIVKCLKSYDVKDIRVVIGTNNNKIKIKYLNKINFISNSKYNKFGNLFSLSLAFDKFKSKSLISYGDIVFNNFALNKLLSFSSEDFVIGYDSTWQNRYANRSNKSLKKVELICTIDSYVNSISKGYNENEQNDGEFCGLFLVSPKGNKIISNILDKEIKENSFLDLNRPKILLD